MELFYYSAPRAVCTCGRINGDTFRTICERMRDGEKTVNILNDLKIMRMCCRMNFLCLTNLLMLEQSVNAYIDEANRIVRPEEDIKPGFILTKPTI